MTIFYLAQAQSNWTQIAALVATALATITAVAATYVNYLLFRSQIDPHVIIYAEPDRRRPSIILLVIENIGKGIARDVKFFPVSPLPSQAFGFEEANMPERMIDGPLITGIPALGPGATRIITWGQYGGLHKWFQNRSIDVTVQFWGDSVGPFDAKLHTITCPLEIKSFEATDESDESHPQKIVEKLDSISKTLAALLARR